MLRSHQAGGVEDSLSRMSSAYRRNTQCRAAVGFEVDSARRARLDTFDIDGCIVKTVGYIWWKVSSTTGV